MKFAIIAAGEGSRLAQEGVNQPKPLVEVAGECLIDRLIRIFTENNATEIVVICRTPESDGDPMARVHTHLQDIKLNGKSAPLTILQKATPSSMHSFYELSRHLTDDKFVLTTVDTIFREEDFKAYISAFMNSDKDGMMGVTDYIDDEKPLYVATQADGKITGFLDKDENKECKYISGGIYGLTPKAIETLNRCIESGQSRMRNFQRGLIEDGLHLDAYPFTKVLDIDHASDIAKAEEFLA